MTMPLDALPRDLMPELTMEQLVKQAEILRERSAELIAQLKHIEEEMAAREARLREPIPLILPE